MCSNMKYLTALKKTVDARMLNYAFLKLYKKTNIEIQKLNFYRFNISKFHLILIWYAPLYIYIHIYTNKTSQTT